LISGGVITNTVRNAKMHEIIAEISK